MNKFLVVCEIKEESRKLDFQKVLFSITNINKSNLDKI